jgi:uncharacterized protein YegJ (DUF2314 family)
MKLLLVLICGANLITAGFSAAQETNTQNTANTTASGPPGYAQVSDDDKQMDRAVKNAQKNLGFFIAALKAKKGGDSVFEIKKCFVDGDKVEHLWVRRVTFDGKNFHGQIDNRPLEVKNARAGERVTVAPAEVDDWMFVKDGDLIGGYTTRVLYARLSPDDKAAFDQQSGFRVK